MTEPLRVLLVGHGRMGRLVETLAPEYGVRIAGVVSSRNAGQPDTWPAADVAIDFSSASAVVDNARALGARGVSLVIGTTGWQAHEPALRDAVAAMPIGVIAAPNFAIGVNLFLDLAERAAAMLSSRGFSPWIHEAHHAAKKDAPSGTAVALQRVVEAAGAPADVSSTRAGHIPGTHTVGFDSPAEAITLTHEARDRTPFARGALEAATWIHGRRGWYTMRDLLSVEGSR
jgi:4-hydroxy-tetrahydrodipicolinate reductase